jgi:hypothetical protein
VFHLTNTMMHGSTKLKFKNKVSVLHIFTKVERNVVPPCLYLYFQTNITMKRNTRNVSEVMVFTVPHIFFLRNLPLFRYNAAGADQLFLSRRCRTLQAIFETIFT